MGLSFRGLIQNNQENNCFEFTVALACEILVKTKFQIKVYQ
jgi:hypothetical protein